MIDRIVMVAAIVMMAAAFVLVFHQGDKLDTQQAQLTRDARELAQARNAIGISRRQLVQACKRLQIVRVEDNISHYADWLVYRSELRAFARLLPQGVTRPIASAVRLKSWVPLTNCRLAVARRGAFYRPPHPVPFSHRRPPRSALRLSPSLFH